jgi:hypothetical protein
MKFISANLIEINKELSDLDEFCLDFVKILRKYSKYVIISGYVSILLGRSRASEDIDILIPKIDIGKFKLLLQELRENEFYCLNAEYDEAIYEYLVEKTAVRFAREDTVVPNIELKFAKNRIDALTLSKPLAVKLNKEELIISHLEMQIAFKEEVLKSPKDMEDARHIRNIAKGHLDESLIETYKRMLHEL